MACKICPFLTNYCISHKTALFNSSNNILFLSDALGKMNLTDLTL